MKFSNIQYSALMQAIENAKNAIAVDEFIDPYGENGETYTNENVLAALEEVEDMLISDLN
jgi:hypothetical protein